MLKSWTRRLFAGAALSLTMFGAGMVPGMASAEEIVLDLWSRADRSGPLRAGNIIAAADELNRMLAAAGSDKSVKIEVFENNAKGFDDDALDMMKAFAVDKGPDIYVLA
ncbi:MAG: hypothetical protein KDH19_03645, partial [Geminicoccaceae bacterium]|nr:hypothetical protein [Geminicoccaceae bacterium]